LLVVAHEDDIRALSEAHPHLKKSCEFRGAKSLEQAFAALKEFLSLKPVLPLQQPAPAPLTGPEGRNLSTLAEVREEKLGVVAALCSIAGNHHCLFAGPHGMGKSMLIRAICEGLSPLAECDRLSREAILRTFGEHFATEAAAKQKPVVALQTSISRAALEGALLNTGQVLPGELTRAHLGVLVADELLEFRRDVIEAFRQPLDEGIVRLQRAKFRAALPSNFQFLASTNLCPCGRLGKTKTSCRCFGRSREIYIAKLSGPILDRFDLIVAIGIRAEDANKIIIPTDLIGDIEALVDPTQWQERLDRYRENLEFSRKGQSSPAEFWSEYTGDASDRGKLKLARVATTLAALLGESRTSKHLRFAELLRQDLRRAAIPRDIENRSKLFQRSHQDHPSNLIKYQ
jgi:Mg-chelatase subunit ChlI